MKLICKHPSHNTSRNQLTFVDHPLESNISLNLYSHNLQLASKRPGMASLQSPMTAAEVAATKQQQPFLQLLHYVAPALVLAYFLITTTISVCTLQHLRAWGAGPRKVLTSLVSLVVISFLVESCMLLTDTAVNRARYSSTDSNVSIFLVPRNVENRAPTSCLLTAI